MSNLEDLLRAAFRAGEEHAYWCADRMSGPNEPPSEDATIARLAATVETQWALRYVHDPERPLLPGLFAEDKDDAIERAALWNATDTQKIEVVHRDVTSWERVEG